MSQVFNTNNPGIGDIPHFTSEEILVIESLATLGDPNADRILFWDDSAGAFAYLSVGTNLTITGTTLDATGGSGSGITRTITITSGSGSMGAAASVDYVYLVAGAHTMTLPTAVGNTNLYTVKNNHSANITIDTTSSQTIDGTLTISIAPQESVDLISTNTNWNII